MAPREGEMRGKIQVALGMWKCCNHRDDRIVELEGTVTIIKSNLLQWVP